MFVQSYKQNPKKFQFLFFFWVFLIFFKRVRFPGEIFVFLQTSFETTDINFEYFLMVFGANESWGFVLLGFPNLMFSAPLVQILGAGKCAIFFRKNDFPKKNQKMAHLRAHRVGSLFRLHIRKERPFLHIWRPWFTLIPLEADSKSDFTKKP